MFPPHPSSSISDFWSSSACCAAFFFGAFAADLNVDRCGDSGNSSSSGCNSDSHLLLLLLLSLSDSAAAATFAAALIAANRCGDRPRDYGGSLLQNANAASSLSALLLSLLLSSGYTAAAVLCCHGGCQHLHLWLDACLFRLKVPVLHGLLKQLVPVGRTALSEPVPSFLILERHMMCLDHIDSSHCIGFALLFLKTQLAWLFRNAILQSNKSSSPGSNP
jgi:hypothetical protein